MIRYAKVILIRAMGRDYHRVPLLLFQETKHFQLQKASRKTEAFFIIPLRGSNPGPQH